MQILECQGDREVDRFNAHSFSVLQVLQLVKGCEGGTYESRDSTVALRLSSNRKALVSYSYDFDRDMDP